MTTNLEAAQILAQDLMAAVDKLGVFSGRPVDYVQLGYVGHMPVSFVVGWNVGGLGAVPTPVEVWVHKDKVKIVRGEKGLPFKETKTLRIPKYAEVPLRLGHFPPRFLAPIVDWLASIPKKLERLM